MTNHRKRLSILVMSFIAYSTYASCYGATNHKDLRRPATSHIVSLGSGEHSDYQPLSKNGFVIVWLKDGEMVVNQHPESVHQGSYEEIKGKNVLSLINKSTSNIRFVLVGILSTFQPLTMEDFSLAANQEFEDASDGNIRLLVSLGNANLSDSRNQNDEGESWKSGPPNRFTLSQGQTAWLAPGMHRLKNLNRAEVRFITIEW